MIHHKPDMGQTRDCTDTKKKQIPSVEVQNSLKDEIQQLHQQLESQFLVRNALENALSFRPLVHDPTNNNSITKPTEDLIEEISVLEMEVVYLEKYLLSMYRRTFDERSKLNSSGTNKRTFSKFYENDFTSKKKISTLKSSKSVQSQDSNLGSQVIVDASIHRSHSSLSQPSARSFRTSLPLATLAETAHLYHSLPLSMFECGVGDTSSVSLAEHLGSSISENDLESPNWLSEEMIKCISAVYCKLADPPFVNRDFPSSPVSCSSPMSESSPRGQCETWSPQHGEGSLFNSWLHNPFPSDGSKEFSISYFSMVEVLGICRDSQSLRGVEHKLQKFRSLVSRLEEVDPRKMKHEEKLAFWINVHNSLVMHAFIVYGIPQSNQKRISLLLKAAYTVGGQSVSVDKIQSSILGCRLPRPGQWFQFLFFSKAKFKAGDRRKSYAMEHSQPLLKFALSSGSRSDPSVRMYTPKGVYQELEMAKEEYIQCNLKVHMENKVLLPKIVESYSKEFGLCSAGLLEMIEHCSPDCLRKSFQQGKLGKKIDWIPHDFNFRFLLSRELAK